MFNSTMPKFLLLVGVLLAAPLFINEACSSAKVTVVTVKALPEVWVETAFVEQVDQLVLPFEQVVSKGQRGYLHSCTHCHGVIPRDLAYDNPQHFVEAVRNGQNEMPALGYKLNAVEVEMIRLYVASCGADSRSC